MQSGKIKHWNQDKGYGFIEVDNQSEEVFFHVSKVKLSQPITIGKPVYFDSERNNKNQLRATRVTSIEMGIPVSAPVSSTAPSQPPEHSRPNANNTRGPYNTHNTYNSRRNRNNKQPKKGWVSTTVSLLILIALVFFGFTELKPELFTDNVPAISTSPVKADIYAITGDSQIDETIALIQQGGPFPYPHKDGSTFYNREGRLPAQSQGYYHEYTVPTPGVAHRGARRIVTGGNPPTVYYLTVDHYDSFTKLEVNSHE